MSRAPSIDLNADVGEGCGFDAGLVPLVTSVNIACGAHAGDAATMREAVTLALESRAAIGAHPGFEDREHFGRREIAVSPGQAARLVVSQLERLQGVAASLGARVVHVKLHGALYNMASRDRALASAVVEALQGRDLFLFALAGSVLASEGRHAGLKVVAEAFADRAYLSDGSLAPRSLPGSVIEEEGRAAEQAVSIAREGCVRCRDGARVTVDAQTLCIHGDKPGCVAFARRIRRELQSAGIGVNGPSG